MPERDNDRIEQFFQRAADHPDVAFNEEDWKKLEARLDAEEGLVSPPPRSFRKFIAATGLSVLLFITVATWMIVQSVYVGKDSAPDHKIETEVSARPAEEPYADGRQNTPNAPQQETTSSDPAPTADRSYSSKPEVGNDAGSVNLDEDVANANGKAAGPTANGQRREYGIVGGASVDEGSGISTRYSVVNIPDRKLFHELISITQPEVRHKQRAMVELPGAEGAKSGEVLLETGQRLAEDQQRQQATPKLSLLLSLAPDFSGTSVAQYSSPGKAYGAMIYYHFNSHWSIGAGAVRNNKEYTGAGEDYTPPAGYWKYYTNGRIPNSIDGACNVLEFPIMIRYTWGEGKRDRILLGGGTSSYLMLNESYRYYFEEPNPGAKEGWSSRNSSRFMFNMVNFSIGYERLILPGLTLGVEPYLKIPIREIGWTNLKLFSTGASVTLRYAILKKKTFPPPVNRRNRGPD